MDLLTSRTEKSSFATIGTEATLMSLRAGRRTVTYRWVRLPTTAATFFLRRLGERTISSSTSRHTPGEKPGVCRDGRDLNQHFLRSAAIGLGLYRQGFGYHAFRREAVTEHGQTMVRSNARMTGDVAADMT